MSWRVRIGAALLTLLLGACTGVPVSTDYNTEYRFQPQSSYAWLEREREFSDPRVDNDLVEARVRRAVDSQLRAKGLTQAQSVESADLLVSYHIGREDKIDVQTFRSHFGYYPCWHCYGPHWGYGPHGDDIWVSEYTQGTLVIDVIDAESRKLVWHGVAERRLPSFKTPQERDAYIRETVTAILARFPPGGAGA